MAHSTRGFDVGKWVKNKMTQPAAPIKNRSPQARPGAYGSMFQGQRTQARTSGGNSRGGRTTRPGAGGAVSRSPAPTARPNTGGGLTSSPKPVPRQDRDTYRSSEPRTSPSPQSAAVPRMFNKIDKAAKAYKGKRDKRFF